MGNHREQGKVYANDSKLRLSIGFSHFLQICAKLFDILFESFINFKGFKHLNKLLGCANLLCIFIQIENPIAPGRNGSGHKKGQWFCADKRASGSKPLLSASTKPGL